MCKHKWVLIGTREYDNMGRIVFSTFICPECEKVKDIRINYDK